MAPLLLGASHIRHIEKKAHDLAVANAAYDLHLVKILLLTPLINLHPPGKSAKLSKASAEKSVIRAPTLKHSKLQIQHFLLPQLDCLSKEQFFLKVAATNKFDPFDPFFFFTSSLLTGYIKENLSDNNFYFRKGSANRCCAGLSSAYVQNQFIRMLKFAKFNNKSITTTKKNQPRAPNAILCRAKHLLA